MRISDTTYKVLIVDDNADTRNAVRMTLEAESAVGYSVSEASSVASGLKTIKNLKPDVIILDLHFPGDDGFVFLDKLDHDHYAFPKTNVIVLTVDDNMKNLWKTESKGVSPYHFMGKPFEGAELRAQVLDIALIHD